MSFWSFTFTANNCRKQLVTSNHFGFVSLRKEHREMVFSYPQNQRQLAAMRLKVLRQNCVRPVDTMPQRHTGAAVARVFIQPKEKKKKNRQTKLRGNGAEVQSRQTKSQYPENKKQSLKRGIGWENNKTQVRHRTETA